jgi:Tol biopolymer transport system component
MPVFRLLNKIEAVKLRHNGLNSFFYLCIAAQEGGIEKMRGIFIFLSLLFFLSSCSYLDKVKQLPFFNRDGKVAYIQEGDVWVKRLPNGLPNRLTTDGNNSNPQWSSSGNWLAFRKKSQLWIMHYNGGKGRMAGAVAPAGAFAWSSGEDTLAYITEAGELWALHAEEDMPKLLAKPSAADRKVDGFVWSPDGKWVVFSLWKDSSQSLPHQWFLKVSPKGDTVSEVYSIDFTKDEGGECCAPGPAILAGWVDDQILFWQADIISVSLLCDGASLYSLPVNTGKPRAQDLNICTLIWNGIITNPSDKKCFAIVIGCGRETYTGKSIAVVAPITGKISSLTHDKMAALWPSWSPDGKQIAYAASPDNGTINVDESVTSKTSQRRIWAMDSNGANKRKLTDDEHYYDERPIWLVNGHCLLFIRIDRNDSASLWLINAVDGKQTKVIDSLSQKNPNKGWPDNYYGHVNWSDAFNYSTK